MNKRLMVLMALSMAVAHVSANEKAIVVEPVTEAAVAMVEDAPVLTIEAIIEAQADMEATNAENTEILGEKEEADIEEIVEV